MSAVKGRRRGAGKPGRTVLVRGHVQPEQAEKAQRAADSAGISLAAYLDLVLSREELDDDGFPSWWPQDQRTQEELPLRYSA